MSVRATEALTRWRSWASTFLVGSGGTTKTWAAYIADKGYVDEEKVVQPTAFPSFAATLLGWDLQVTLAPEETGASGKPDFTPADSVTHPFVFETKGTSEQTDLSGHEAQIARYLHDGAPRIKKVALTNLVAVWVYDLDGHGHLRLRTAIDLRGLLAGPVETVAKMPQAEALADLLDEFSRRQLTAAEKLARVRAAQPWNSVVEVTSSEWILRRVDRAVTALTASAMEQIKAGRLTDPTFTTGEERGWITAELRVLASRLGGNDPGSVSLRDFVSAKDTDAEGKALAQFAAHVAYYAATRLMLVRVWEDLGLLSPMLYDGGFDTEMARFNGVVADVVSHSFTRAKDRYRSLFDASNSYTWFTPDPDTYADVIYELANTYLGAIESDVLGQVYERLLERIDRKLLGVYYTPRDVIALIWDMLGFPDLAAAAEADGRGLRVLDIATGSGGFLVDVARRERERLADQLAAGAGVDLQEWIVAAADGLNGVELNRFSAYLAELNLLVQFGRVIATGPSLRLPPMGVLSADSLSLHNPDTLPADWHQVDVSGGLLADDTDRRERAQRIAAAASAEFLMDVAVGNPPYVGEKTASPMLQRTRSDYPYWEQFVGAHMDYLYWFLILGVSKLRAGGRFGFITTEYWLRSEGAKPLRRYLAGRAQIDQVVLFRGLRLFPAAPGQHSMIVTGTRVADPDQTMTALPGPIAGKPKVAIYTGPRVLAPAARKRTLRALAEARTSASAHVSAFTSQSTPAALGEGSWGDLILTRAQLRERKHLTTGAQVPVSIDEGVIAAPQRLSARNEVHLTGAALASLGGPGSRAGIYQLTQNEVAALGPLSPAETDAVRRMVNTRDIYPYAVVLPTVGPSLLYLPKGDVRTLGAPFPAGMPALEAHLTRFRGLLSATVQGYGDKRPWWSVHRAREHVVGDAGVTVSGWADYLVMARWGEGASMVVGRAPHRSTPASGLHVLRSDKRTVPPGYLTGLFNSTLYQEMAQSLPPAMVRTGDLRAIGLPLRPAATAVVATTADELAELVVTLVRMHGQRFPALGEELRANPALVDLTEDIWLPQAGPTTSWGTVGSVRWVHHMEALRARSTLLGDVTVRDDVLGVRVEVADRGTERPAVVVWLERDVERSEADALAALLRGRVLIGALVRDVADVAVPVAVGDLVAALDSDRSALRAVATRYRACRALIDETLARLV